MVPSSKLHTPRRSRLSSPNPRRAVRPAPPRRPAKRGAALEAIAASVREVTLRNGLKVRLLPDASVPTCSLFTFFQVGSRNERPGITGISHLFEHMMFNGAEKYGPGEFDRVLEANGGTSNAYTSHDLTVYYEDFMAEALETVLDLEADRMRSLRVTPKLLESERQVVIEERRLRVENEIPGLLEEELSALAYRAHPYRWPVIGWMKDIESIRRQDCLEYFQTYYAPSNATLFLAGDFDPERALALIEAAYGDIPRGGAIPTVVDAEPPQRGERRAVVRFPAQNPSLVLAWRGPKANAPDTLALDVLQFALSVGQSSRLVRSLVYERELAVSVGVDWSWRVDPGLFTVALELKPDADPKASEEAVKDAIDALVERALTNEELERAANNLSAHLLRELATNGGRAGSLGSYEAMLGSWREGLALTERYAAIEGKAVREAAWRYLGRDGCSVVTLEPQTGGAP